MKLYHIPAGDLVSDTAIHLAYYTAVVPVFLCTVCCFVLFCFVSGDLRWDFAVAFFVSRGCLFVCDSFVAPRDSQSMPWKYCQDRCGENVARCVCFVSKLTVGCFS